MLLSYKGMESNKITESSWLKKLDKLFEFKFSHKVKECLILLQELKVRLDPGARLAQMQQGLKSRGIPRVGTDYGQPGGGESLCFGVILCFGINICFAN